MLGAGPGSARAAAATTGDPHPPGCLRRVERR
jgi:hypothetical protein